MNRVVLITGANSGFGKLMVERFSSNGDRVIAGMRNSNERKNIFQHLKNVDCIEMDLTKDSDISALVEHIKNQYGQLDILINNAGFGAYGAFEDISKEMIQSQMNVNFFSTAILTQKLIPYLKKSKGKIIFLSSVMGYASMPLSSIYSASKFAVEGLAQGLMYELAPFGVDVCLVCPGRHRTQFADNIKWAAFPEGGDYANLYQGLQKMMNKLRNEKPIPASNVSDKIFETVNLSKMPNKVIVGDDAKAIYFLSKLLPFNLFIKLTARIYNKGLNNV